MATLGSVSVNAKSTGVSTVVPDDDIARLMYYLNCVTVGVGLDILPSDLTDYKSYRFLTPARIALVFKCAVEFSPDEFIGKLIFRDDAGEVCKTTTNEFVTISTACNIVSLQRDIIVAGKVQDVTKVMFFRTAWLDKNYIKPIERIARAVLNGTSHCSHCDGGSGLCKCGNRCARGTSAKCTPSLGRLLMSAPTPAKIVHYGVNCDGCSTRGIEGARYKCNACYDFDLCSTCYNRNVHDTTHSFSRHDRPGATPVRLASRRAPPAPITPAPAKKSPSLFSFGRASSTSTSTSSSSSSFRFKKDDTVILTGLARGDMNGKRATILSIDHSAQKAQIRVIGMDNTFKVKFEHLKSLGEDSDEELF